MYITSKRIGLICTLMFFSGLIWSQEKCYTSEYLQTRLSADPSWNSRIQQIEDFTSSVLYNQQVQRSEAQPNLIKVPVVFHVLYHSTNEKISKERIESLLALLNRDFRRDNPDTVNTPDRFAPLAADMEIEFYFARSDPEGKSTSGIVRKYTPVVAWQSDDKMKFSASYGSNAWDARYYLNIWLCNLEDVSGYATLPGGDLSKDGVVLDFSTFSNSTLIGNASGRTLVHETGHWLNLRHLWGDSYCGDDRVDDTPKQAYYTPGCPTGIRTSCGTDPNGDMYMNYMDFTNDACMNMFTQGQKQRAHALFKSGGARESILSSKGLNDPLIIAQPEDETVPEWMFAKLYPNPAHNSVTVDMEYDPRWIGQEMRVTDISGKMVLRKTIRALHEEIDIRNLKPGLYIIWADKDRERLQAKFIKL